MKVLFTASIICLGLFFGFIYIINNTSHERYARGLLHLCKSIEPGISIEELIGIMGDPLSMNEDKETGIQYYYFDSPRAASELTSVHTKDGLVILINCGEEYRKY